MSDRPPELDKLLDYVAGTITPEQEALGIMATALIEAGDSSAAKAALIVKGIAEELKLRDAEILRLRASRNEVIEMCAKVADTCDGSRDNCDDDQRWIAERIAASIRALKSREVKP